MGINLNVSPRDDRFIDRCVQRAKKENFVSFDSATTSMALAGAKNSGLEVNLQALYESEREDFLHDILGILQHMDWHTGELNPCFIPRCACDKVEEVVLCIPLSDDFRHTLAIRKNSPPWQAGRLNFPGGHVEKWEDPRQAAARELEEETGISVPKTDLQHVATMLFYTQDVLRSRLHVYKCSLPILGYVQKTAEQVSSFPVGVILESAGDKSVVDHCPLFLNMAVSGLRAETIEHRG